MLLFGWELHKSTESKFLVGQSRELQRTLTVSTWKLFISTLECRHQARTDQKKPKKSKPQVAFQVKVFFLRKLSRERDLPDKQMTKEGGTSLCVGFYFCSALWLQIVLSESCLSFHIYIWSKMVKVVKCMGHLALSNIYVLLLFIQITIYLKM